MNEEKNYLAALDVGSTATRVLVAEVLDSGEEASQLRFRGWGAAESRGWRKGAMADLEQVSKSVKQAVERAEASAGVLVESAVVGMGGSHIQGMTSHAGLALSTRPREVNRDDIRRVMEAARQVPLAKDREIFHMVPQEFLLDGQDGIRDPLGLQASRLEAKVHIISGSLADSQNIVTAVNRAGVVVETMVGEAFAVGEAVLTTEERELGALVAIVGGSHSELVVYYRGSLRLSATVPIGGDHFTNDAAIGLQTSLEQAEEIKKLFGSVCASGIHEGTSFEVPGLGNRPSRLVPRSVLLYILEPRAQELLGLILEWLLRSGLEHHLGGGVVLCGGGARLQGMCDVAEQFFSSPARLGLPPKIPDLPETLDSPEYATLLGLLLYGLRVRRLRMARHRPLATRWKGLLGRKSREGAR